MDIQEISKASRLAPATWGEGLSVWRPWRALPRGGKAYRGAPRPLVFWWASVGLPGDGVQTGRSAVRALGRALPGRRRALVASGALANRLGAQRRSRTNQSLQCQDPVHCCSFRLQISEGEDHGVSCAMGEMASEETRHCHREETREKRSPSLLAWHVEEDARS